MSGRSKHRRDELWLPAIDPATGKLVQVQISHGRLQAMARFGQAHVLECAYIVPEILERPSAIFEGLKRDQDEDSMGAPGWRCYCGRPSVAFNRDGSERRPFPQQIFMVFVNQERIAYNWRWEKADPDNLNLPLNCAARFVRRSL